MPPATKEPAVPLGPVPPFLERWQGVSTLASHTDAAAERELLAALTDPEPFVRLAAAEGLAAHSRTDQAHEAALRLLQHTDPRLRASALVAQGTSGRPDALPRLTEGLGEGDSGLRLAAVQALVALGTPEAVPRIGGALGDHEASVRLAAVQGLARLGSAAGTQLAALDGLQKCDPDPKVRAACRAAIQQIQDALKRAPAELEAADPVFGRGTELESSTAPEGRGTELQAAEVPPAQEEPPKRRRWPWKR